MRLSQTTALACLLALPLLAACTVNNPPTSTAPVVVQQPTPSIVTPAPAPPVVLQRY